MYPQKQVRLAIRAPLGLQAEPTEYFVAALEAVAVRARGGEVVGRCIAAPATRLDVVQRGCVRRAAVGAAVAPRLEDVVAKTPLGVTLVQQVGFRYPVIHWRAEAVEGKG